MKRSRSSDYLLSDVELMSRFLRRPADFSVNEIQHLYNLALKRGYMKPFFELTPAGHRLMARRKKKYQRHRRAYSNR